MTQKYDVGTVLLKQLMHRA